jgi:2-polyprenyl-3-methyl-5-hydroxy-6-metoxy-1,4-benzoquinol methylase
MSNSLNTSQYHFGSADALHTADYLTDHVLNACRRLGAKRVLDLGCGNGAMCGALSSAGFEVAGCDPSEDGIAFARQSLPQIPFHLLGVYDEPTALGAKDFDVVVSTEVVEHLFMPRALPRFASKVLRPGGSLIVTTPYHGYLKNLILALTGKLDGHFTALWDCGHIKFWSRKTLTELLSDEGFTVSEFIGAGRIPLFWKSMILIAQKQ